MSLKDLTNEIRESIIVEGGKTTSSRSSQRDELRVMKEMLNDTEYTYDIYDKAGNTTPFSPAQSAREMVAGIISTATKVSKEEATQISENYKFGNKEAKNMVDLSKSFVNTYLQTGRKLPLGGTDKFMSDLVMVHVDEKPTSHPHKNEDGTWEIRTSIIPEHDKIKSISPCPRYLK